jgi:glutamate--cysteine ligase
MSNPGEADGTPISSVRQLAEYIEAGCKPRAAFSIGTEHEKFGFRLSDLAPPPYEAADRAAIKDVLEAMERQGGDPIRDSGNIIGMTFGGASVSLEPAGQFELSGAPLETLHETERELQLHLDQVRAIGSELGLGFAPLGFHPIARREDMPWMPKGRYEIMRRYMPKVGKLGLDMMTRTCTVQANLDFESEEDMRRKLRVGLALQPLATALFANSPFTEGKPNGFLSYRAHVWTDTDPNRSGMPQLFFEEGFGFLRYAEWVVDHVPMYFVYRNGRYIDVAGRSFRDFLQGRVPELAGIVPVLGDFADHLTTVFTDVRVKRFLEMRGADAGSPAMMLALPALWVGLLYDPAALDAAWDLVRSWTWAECQDLRAAVPRQGLDAKSPAGSLRDVGKNALAIARQGLRARGRLSPAAADEAHFLDPLDEIAAGGPVPAQVWLQKFESEWRGDASRLLRIAKI